jgi:hypothetical protein
MIKLLIIPVAARPVARRVSIFAPSVETHTDPPRPPGDVYVHRRWIPPARVEWVQACDEIMLEHGAVTGSRTYPVRHLARWRAQSADPLDGGAPPT